MQAESWDVVLMNESEVAHVYRRRQQPWECCQCHQLFKYDNQLLRHERKENHQNLDRQLRRFNRATNRKGKGEQYLDHYILCIYCGTKFDSKKQRCSHYAWCQEYPGNKLQKYRSSFRNFQCNDHQLNHYFATVDKLKQHLKTHRQNKNNQIQKTEEVKVTGEAKRVRSKMTEYLKNVLIEQFKRIKTFSKYQIQRIASYKKLSVSTVRRYYKKFKENII